MRIVFIGASRFGLRCLEALTEVPGCRVVGVVTAPQTFSISYRKEGVKNVLFADIAKYACEESIPSFTVEKGMKDPGLLGRVKDLSPDCFIVIGWYHMIPKSWRDVAPAYGMHASLLPKYSGGAPLVWAILNGEKRTGITLFLFDNGVDSGPILGQRETSVNDSDTIGSVYGRIEDLGIDLLHEYLPKLRDGNAVGQRQEEAKRTTFPQRGPEDGIIDWGMNERSLFNFVRAQTRPYPGAFSYLGSRKIYIWRCRMSERRFRNIEVAEGTLFLESESVFVAVLGGALELEEFSYENQASEETKSEVVSRLQTEQVLRFSSH